MGLGWTLEVQAMSKTGGSPPTSPAMYTVAPHASGRMIMRVGGVRPFQNADKHGRWHTDPRRTTDTTESARVRCLQNGPWAESGWGVICGDARALVARGMDDVAGGDHRPALCCRR